MSALCLPRCTCHIRLSLLEKLLRRRVFEEAFIVCLFESPEITQAPTDGSRFCFSLRFQGVARDPARPLDGVKHITQPCAIGVDGRSREPFSPPLLQSTAVVASETKPVRLPWLIDVKE